MKHPALLLAIAAITISCGDSSLTRTLPNVSGASGEVLVVMDKGLWEAGPGEALKSELAAPLVGLPQDEPAFDLLQIAPAGFRDLFLVHRNVILAGINSGKSEPEMMFSVNRWSETQLVINISAPDTASLTRIIREKGSDIRARINDAERMRITAWLMNSAGREKATVSNATNKLEIIMPSGYRTDFSREGLLIISSETPATTQSVIISLSDRSMPAISCIELADLTEKITSGSIKGPGGKSYMVIEKYMQVRCTSFRRNGTDFIEMRGLWTLEGGYMGGPFISYAYIDPVTAKPVIVIGFVYAPREDKRELLRQVEALMYCVRKADVHRE